MNYLDERGRIEKSLGLTNIVDIDGYPTAPNITRKSFDWYKTVMKTMKIDHFVFLYANCPFSTHFGFQIDPLGDF